MARSSVMAFVMAAAATLAVAAGPFLPMAPCVQLSASDRQQLAAGERVSRALRSRGHHVAVYAATQISATSEDLVSAVRAIADLKQSSFVVGIRRFSEPQALSDLDELALTDRDLSNLAACELRRCSFKLTADEINNVISLRGGASDRASLALAFKTVLLGRVRTYLATGLAGMPPIENRSKPWRLDDTLLQLQTASGCIAPGSPVASWLANYPGEGQQVESFVYWSQEFWCRKAGDSADACRDLACWRRRRHRGRQAGRYVDGGITVTALTTDPTTGVRHLTYLNLTSVDLPGGMFGSLKRGMLGSRLSRELPEVIAKPRSRLERTTS